MISNAVPTLEEFNNAIDKLLSTLKYIKFSEFIISLIEKILLRLSEFFESFTGGAISTNSVNVVLIIIVILIVIIFIGLVIFLIRKRKRKRKVNRILGEEINEETTVESLIEKSIEYENNSLFREAVRIRYIAILFFLHENHYLYHDQSMTGVEMVNQLAREEFIALDHFSALTYMFNKIWYGLDNIEGEVFQDWKKKEVLFWQEVKA